MPMEPRKSRRVNRFQLQPEPCSHGPYAGYTGLDRINSAARKNPSLVFANLLHHLSEANLRQAFRQLDGSKAVGIDQVTKQDYQKNLDSNLAQLAEEISRGGWRPRPAREVLIPKASGGTRPLAIGCLEDKLIQLLCAKILEAVYEDSFHRHSYGFRPQRNPHQAIARLYSVLRERQENSWVVEMDIEKFFNSVDHERLIEILSQRIEDGHFLRLIRRMLRNSILSEEGEIRRTEKGTPQGAPISPILANIYLHFCLDLWFEENWGAQGQMVRYADDAVFVFTCPEKAAQFKEALAQRLQEFGGLKLNEDKSGLLRFDCHQPQGPLPFLGFQLYWGRNYRNKSKPQLKIKTEPKKLAKAVTQFTDWIRAQRCRKRLDDLWTLAAAKFRGHYSYYGVSFNLGKLNHFYFACIQALLKWLNRRSQKQSFTQERFARRLRFKPLPKPSGAQLVDITLGLVTGSKHKTKSRMRKLRTYGSERSPGLSPVFT